MLFSFIFSEMHGGNMFKRKEKRGMKNEIRNIIIFLTVTGTTLYLLGIYLNVNGYQKILWSILLILGSILLFILMVGSIYLMLLCWRDIYGN